jgi:hypothetical protein
MKRGVLCLREWTSPFEPAEALKRWIDYYYGSYMQSTLGYTAPNAFER